MTKGTVLIIDDDPDLKKLLAYEIKRAGFTTVEAETVNNALQLLNTEDIDVVLTDVHLPDGNGVEFTRMIKTAYPYIEVIAITSQGKIADGIQAIKNGALDYLVKGEDQGRLISLLTHAADKSILQRRINNLEKDISLFKNNNNIIAQNLQQLERATLIIKAIHSPLRQRIMEIIFTQGKATVKEIYTQMEIPQPIASQHLQILKNAGLVTPGRQGKSVSYSANYVSIEKVIAFVQQMLTVS